MYAQVLEWCGRAVLPWTVAGVGSVVQFLPLGCVLSHDLYALVESLPGMSGPTKQTHDGFLKYPNNEFKCLTNVAFNVTHFGEKIHDVAPLLQLTECYKYNCNLTLHAHTRNVT